MLTAITTILGLVPTVVGWGFDFRGFHFQASGESSSWWRPMGVAVMFGLAFATFLTLMLVPVLYDLLLEWRERRSGGKESSGEGKGSLAPPVETPAG